MISLTVLCASRGTEATQDRRRRQRWTEVREACLRKVGGADLVAAAEAVGQVVADRCVEDIDPPDHRAVPARAPMSAARALFCAIVRVEGSSGGACCMAIIRSLQEQSHKFRDRWKYKIGMQICQ